MFKNNKQQYSRQAGRRGWFFFLLLSCIFALNLFIGFRAYSDSVRHKPDDDGYESVSMLMNVIQLIRDRYVDKDKVTYKKLINNALRGMIDGLDPFSSYLDQKHYSDMILETEGRNFGGLGIHIVKKNNKLIVIAPMQDSPAFKAGIKPGDTIIYIDEVPTASMSMPECVKLLKGDPDTKVKLTVYREKDKVAKVFNVTRKVIIQSTVKWGFNQEDQIGYIRISLFNKPTAADLDKALNKLLELNAVALVIDLRGNPGGLLASAVDVCSRFLEKDELVVFVEGRDNEKRHNFYANEASKLLNMPLAVLINGGSASAAEIVAGCLQDHNRAVLIGERSFGKGSVQSIIPLPDDCAVKMTTAKYYTPSEKVIHGEGIDPDIAVPVDAETGNQLFFQAIAYPGEVMPDASDAVRDTQLERAIELLKGICLFKSNREE